MEAGLFSLCEAYFKTLQQLFAVNQPCSTFSSSAMYSVWHWETQIYPLLKMQIHYFFKHYYNGAFCFVLYSL